MAKAKVETNNEYLDANPAEFSHAIQQMVNEEREIYELLKAQKARLLVAIQAEMPVESGREIKRTAYTAWGQWQIVVGDKVAPKAASAGRRTLADYLAAQGGNGHAV